MQINQDGWLENEYLPSTFFEILPSPNFDQRPSLKHCLKQQISLLVIHCISLPPGEYENGEVEKLFLNKLNIEQHEYYLEHLNNKKLSAHVFIKRSGKIIQFVSFKDRAWHAGVSSFNNQTHCNDFSIGIELEGLDSDVFEPAQYDSLLCISRLILKTYPEITLDHIVGHEFISPGRKTDPGRFFKWDEFKTKLKKTLKIKTPILLGVVGKNIAYSQSPKLHYGFAKAELGLLPPEFIYQIEEVSDLLIAGKISGELEAQEFKAKIEVLKNQKGYLGCNITVPYKEIAFELADELTPRAEQAGAVNTYLFKNNKIFGDNTDGVGFIQDLFLNKNYQAEICKSTQFSILILGTGGAVKGLLGPLVSYLSSFDFDKNIKSKIYLVSRDLNKSQMLAAQFKIKKDGVTSIVPMDYLLLRQEKNKGSNFKIDLIIDGTSLREKTPNLPNFEENNFSEISCLYDLKYFSKGEKTPMMHWAESLNIKNIYDGLGMLEAQAELAFDLWVSYLNK